MNAPEEGREVVSMSVESGTVALLNKSEIESQVDTAHKYPRSIKRFLDEASQMVTLNESIAQQCVYALLRWDGKKQQNSVIEGPSARFAEIVASAWGNCRAGARVVSEGQEFVTSQGVFHDLERNVAITLEVQRRITGSNGARYKADMIGVTANAASSIALRNAILKGVPKAFWESLYQKARAVVAGDLKTLSVKRTEAIKQFALFGVSEAQILEKLGRQGVADVTVDDLVVLFGLLTAIKDGDTTPEQAFDAAPASEKKKEPPAAYPQAQFDKNIADWHKLIASGKKISDQIVAMANSKAQLTAEQIAAIKNNPQAQGAASSAQASNGATAGAAAASVTFAQVESSMLKAKDIDVLDVAADLIGEVSDPQQRAELAAIYTKRKEELSA